MDNIGRDDLCCESRDDAREENSRFGHARTHQVKCGGEDDYVEDCIRHDMSYLDKHQMVD